MTRQVAWGRRREPIDRVIKRMCQENGIGEEELRNGGKRRKVSEVRTKISYPLSHEMGIPFAEIARHVGVFTYAVANAVQSLEFENG